VPAAEVTHTVHLPDGTSRAIPPVTGDPVDVPVPAPQSDVVFSPGRTTAPLGAVCGARSGDKGGNANIGLWARTDRGYAWLRQELTVGRLRELLTEAADLPVHRYELPNLHALNFVVEGVIAPGVAATARPDAQAKGLGEYLRSRLLSIPTELIEEAR
jgi:hypothetical protein